MDLEALTAIWVPFKIVSVFLVIIAFLGVIAYALWPSKKKSFDHASHLPLNED
jgi:cytochrome c oxidase cbb3-type subunit IV